MQIVDFRRQKEQFYVNQFHSKLLTEKSIDKKVCLIIFLRWSGGDSGGVGRAVRKKRVCEFFFFFGGGGGGRLMRRLVATCSDAPLSPVALPGSSSSAS